MTTRMFYLLICRNCGNGDLVMPFDSPAERGKWASGHTGATGHDRWFVTEADHRLSREQVAGMLARHDEVLRGMGEGVLVTSHELVIRLGRPFDVQTRDGTFLVDVTALTIPFDNREAAESALQDVQMYVRPVHAVAGENYRPVIKGEVVRADAITAAEKPADE